MTQISSTAGVLPINPALANPALARLVAEEHFRNLSLLRRLGLALRLVTIRRAARDRRGRRGRRDEPLGTVGVGLSAHIRADIGLPCAYERVEPPHWYPPPFY
ncbi:hypothetical protein [Phaeobacter sp. B1627]|uniref:hypothetical protein n=1 Tax=Phaeobacter sp. B1627 TaxID=2583809 RepID=UPI00111A7C61|nr:hypothetical protein [Phaeobacter sp. B1627]TNJ48487.1 hypothetical protein FGE21_00635 [Phaeobacter sp. B1627]